MTPTDHSNTKKRIWKKTVIILAVCFITGLAAAALFIKGIYQFAETPAGSKAETVIFSIQPGQTIRTVAGQLHARKLIDNPLKFRILSRIKGLDNQLKIGEYQLSASMPPNEILDILVSGKSVLYRVTIPEGYTLKQISQAIEKSGLAANDQLYQAAIDPEFARERGIPADTFEGYLFPDTYLFPKGTPPRKIIAAMADRFEGIFTPQWKTQAQQLGFTIHQIVTLASMIEKETGAPSERPIIASVFHNRIRKRMRLESDPTVIYAIADFNGNLTRKHLQTYTPYNTYKISGLPPGPIANPGQKALEAALYPAKTKFLFFVAKQDGTHHFSASISEHNKAVRKYQIRRKRKR